MKHIYSTLSSRYYKIGEKRLNRYNTGVIKVKAAISKTYHHFMNDSLYRNSIYLLLNLGVTALSGFLFVVLCTRLYSQREFGFATALLGALTLVVGLSNMGMNRTVVRFLGKSSTQSQDVVTKLVLVGSLAAIIATGLSASFHSFGLPAISLTASVVFILAAIGMSLKGLLDNVFVAVRASVGTLAENGVFNILKLTLPIFFIGFGFMGIVSAQLIGAFTAVILSLAFLKIKLGLNLKTRPHQSSMSGKWQFAFGSYTSDLIGGLPASILPILVVARFGPIAGALWYIVMQIINLLLMISSSINQAMFAEMSHATHHMGLFMKKAVLIMYSLLLPVSGILFVMAPVVLRIFNTSYVSATNLLRLMIIFALLGVINYITGSILALHKKVLYLTFVNVINALVVVGYVLWVANGLEGVAIGWVLGEGVNLILFAGGAIYFTRRKEIL